MRFSDEGIIISQKKYGENSLIVKVFSQNHGIYRGFIKSVKSSKERVIYQIGNLISFEYRSRLEENLGQLAAVDLVKSYGAKILFDRLRLSCANSVFAIIDSVFLERENHQKLFEDLKFFLAKLASDASEKKDFLADYIKLELEILTTLGYGIDLSCCVVTNAKTNLAFVSPKSAHAVSLGAGMPYQSKLLKLPEFLVKDADYGHNHLLDGLNLSGYFLEKFAFEEKNENVKKQHFSYRESILKSLDCG